MTLRIGIVGATGRMGRALIAGVLVTSDAKLSSAVTRAGDDGIGQDAGRLVGMEDTGIIIHTDAAKLFALSDAVLDFTRPEVSVHYARLAAEYHVAHIIGTTGFSYDQLGILAQQAEKTVIIRSGNMSLGVNLLAALVEKVAAALGPEFDIEIVEMHHRYKVDAPSGTALLLGEAAASGREVHLENTAVRRREGRTGPREEGSIGFASLRGGSVVGDHTVMFAGPSERIELSHKAEDRSIFVRGAIKAAQWSAHQKPGLYTMCDVLGLTD
jgi:4-hydroxy-tetrahydrodipicolinate reductase